VSDSIFAFTLHTEKEFDKGDSLFDTSGEVIGRILSKLKLSNSTGFSYDVESTKKTYEDVESGAIRIWSLDKYSVHKASTYYTHVQR